MKKFNSFLIITLVLGFIAFTTASSSAFAAKPCKSEAYEKADALEFCTNKLNCAEDEFVKCAGTARRWICKCKKAKAVGEEAEELAFKGDAYEDCETRTHSITIE